MKERQDIKGLAGVGYKYGQSSVLKKFVAKCIFSEPYSDACAQMALSSGRFLQGEPPHTNPSSLLTTKAMFTLPDERQPERLKKAKPQFAL